MMPSRSFFCSTLCLVALVAAQPVMAQDLTSVVHVSNPPNLRAQQSRHYVVLVSLDGFRYDYVRVHGAPNLDAMAKAGASTPKGMLPSYPSITFPNHYALVTGLRPEHHGIVAMEFRDPNRDESYAYNKPANADGTWYSGTPLWVLAEQQGMRSACMFWPGSEAAIQGVRPTFYLHFDDKLDDTLRVRQVLAWLRLPESERPHLITLYYSNVDHAGHDFGPDSVETRNAVHHVDEMVGLLREAIRSTGLPVTLIVTADHGMVKAVLPPVVLDNLADLSKFKSAGMQLYAPDEDTAEATYKQLQSHQDPRFSVYRRLDVPLSLHYQVSAREGDPVIVANGPYQIYVHPPTKKPNVGSHGFDPHRMPEMKAIFYAEGPDIRPGVKLKSFDNVDVYSFAAKLLGLEPAPNDGSVASLQRALKQ